MKSKFDRTIYGKQPALVYFYASWCRHCKSMPPILKSAKQQLGDKVKIVRVDIDKDIVTATKYKVKSVPTLILFKNGVVTFRQVGIIRANGLVRKLKPLL